MEKRIAREMENAMNKQAEEGAEIVERQITEKKIEKIGWVVKENEN